MKILNYFKKLLKRNTSNTYKGYYLTIDELPLHNWIQCHENKVEFVRKDLKKGNDLNDIQVWNKIQDEYLKEFGLNEAFINLMNIQVEKAQAELDFVITEKRQVLNKINQLEAKLQQILVSKGENIDVKDVIIYINRHFKTSHTIYSITVDEYFRMINIYTKENATTN
jgi:hypothetical protein